MTMTMMVVVSASSEGLIWWGWIGFHTCIGYVQKAMWSRAWSGQQCRETRKKEKRKGGGGGVRLQIFFAFSRTVHGRNTHVRHTVRRVSGGVHCVTALHSKKCGACR